MQVSALSLSVQCDDNKKREEKRLDKETRQAHLEPTQGGHDVVDRALPHHPSYPLASLIFRVPEEGYHKARDALLRDLGRGVAVNVGAEAFVVPQVGDVAVHCSPSMRLQLPLLLAFAGGLELEVALEATGEANGVPREGL